MTDFALTVVRLILTALALAVTPWLLVRRTRPDAAPVAVAVDAGLTALVLNSLVLLALHCLGVPIRALSLCCIHAVFFCVCVVLQFKARTEGDSSPWHLRLPTEVWWVAGAFFLLVFPFTHLAGIDTYKWQNVATAIRVDERISWLIHPSSLLGFTPRSYPCLHPFLLATVQIVGGVGVKGGFFVVSLFSGLLATLSTYQLGQRVFTDKQKAFVFTFLYVFSPLFVRYNHWSTGRGLLMALLPAFLYSLVFERGVRRVCRTVLLGILVATAHKSGAVAAVSLPLLVVVSLLVPTNRLVRMGLLILACAAGMAFAPGCILPGPAGCAVGAVRFALTRFGLLLPLCLLGMYRAWPARRFLQVCLLGLVVWLPLSFHSRVYAALIALPFAAVPAVFGLCQLEDMLALARQLTRRCVLIVCMAGAVTTVVHRSSTAASQEVVIAARMLEHIDPLGPYQLVAPGLARRQIQAYVSGCPRVSVATTDHARVEVGAPPSLRNRPARIVQQWIGYLRTLFELSDVDVDWYGKAPRRYYVVIDGRGERPRDAKRLARDGAVEIYGVSNP